MTREEILSIEGVKESIKNSFKYKTIIFSLNTELSSVDLICDREYHGIWIDIKPISDPERLKQFLNFFDI